MQKFAFAYSTAYCNYVIFLDSLCAYYLPAGIEKMLVQPTTVLSRVFLLHNAVMVQHAFLQTTAIYNNRDAALSM